jgi:cell division protein WhiA
VSAPPGFTEGVRQELARLPLGDDREVLAELAVLVRLAGALELRRDDGDPVTLSLTTPSGAVARRAFALVVAVSGQHPEVAVRAAAGAGGRASYRVRVPGGGPLARRAGLLDDDGRPLPATDPPSERTPAIDAARWRGALLAAASVSAPGRPAHLEVVAPAADLADVLVAALGRLVEDGRARHDATRGRVVVKSGATIGELLARTGATRAFLDYDERRLRRQLRDDVTRVTNADAANLRRAIDASAVQVAAVERLVEHAGWDGLDDEEREVALVRLTNPEATLAELAGLLGVARTTVHRRLGRLVERAADEARAGA